MRSVPRSSTWGTTRPTGARRRNGRLFGRVVGSLGLVALLMACGGDDDSELVALDREPDEVVVDPLEPEGDATDDAGADGTDGGTGEGTGEDPDAEVDASGDEGGMASHRPSSGLDVAAECTAITTSDPGASIVFPADGDDAGEGPVTVEVVGCSNTFEANLVYEAYHGEDRSPTLTENTMGGSMGAWAPFGFEETYWTPGEWTIVVLEEDASSGERQEYDRVTVNVG